MKPTLSCALLLVLAVLAAFWPVWLRGETLMAAAAGPGVTARGPVGADRASTDPVADAVAAYIDEPLAVYTSHLLARDEWPWWNPHNGLGVSLQGNWQTSIGSPLRLLVHWFPRGTWSFDATYLLRLLLGGIGTLLLALRLGLPRSGAFSAGLVFGLCGYFVRYLQMHHLNAEVLLPWLLWTCDRLARRPSLRILIGHGLVVYSVVTGGNPQPILLIALAASAFCLWRAKVWGGRALWRVLLCSIPPVLLAAFYWLAGLEYVAHALHHHSAGFGADAYTAAGALGFVLPRPYDPGRFDLVAPYFGLLPILIALLGLGRGLGKSVFLWGLFLLCAGKIAGLPGTGWLGSLPGLSLIKLFKYLYPLATLALALLCGAGVAAAIARRIPRRRLLVCVAAVGGLSVLLLVAAYLAEGGSPRDAKGVPYLRFAGWAGLSWRVLLVGLLAFALRLPRASRRGICVSALLGLELIFATPSRWMPRHDPFAKPAYLQAWRGKRAGSFRTFGIGGILMPNQNAVFGIDDIRLHDGVFPRRYAELVRRFLNPNVRHWPVFTGQDMGELPADLLPTGLEIANLLLPQQIAQDIGPSKTIVLDDPRYARYLDLVNVRYLITPANAVTAAVARRMAARPEKAYRITFEDEDAIILERRSALKRAFFPGRIAQVPDMAAAFEAMARPEFEPRRTAFLEMGAPGPGEPSVTKGPSSGTARVDAEKSSSTRFVFTVQTTEPAWLVISMLPYSGMHAELQRMTGRDRKTRAARIVPADGALSAVLVPAGRSRLTIRYAPSFLALGSGLFAAGALGLLLAAFWMARKGPGAD